MCKRQLFMVDPVDVHGARGVLIGEEFVHHCSGKTETVARVDPLILEDLLVARVWRADGG